MATQKLTREDFESDETWAKYQAKKAEKEPAREPAAAPGIAREEAFRRKSADYSQLGGSFTRSAKAKRSENWGAFAHSGLIALDLASLGTLGVARITGENIRRLKEGPQDRPLTTPEKIKVELQILAVQKANAEALGALRSGNRQAIAKATAEQNREQAKLDQQLKLKHVDASAKIGVALIKADSDSLLVAKEQMVADLAVYNGEISTAEQKIVDEYVSRFKGTQPNTTEYQNAVVELADKLKGLDALQAHNMLEKMGEHGVGFKDAIHSDVMQKDASITIFTNKLDNAQIQRHELKSSIQGLDQNVKRLERQIEGRGYRKATRTVIGEDGQPYEEEYVIEGSAAGAGVPGLDLTYLRNLISNVPDIRPESQKIIEAARKTDEYRYAMEEIGLNPDDVIDQQIYEKESRKQMRHLKRLKKRALRKGVPLEQLPQFQEYLAEVKAGGQGAPKLSNMRKQLLLMYAGVDIDALTGPSGQGIMGEDLEALPEAEGLSIAERTAAQKDQLQGNLGASSRLANLRGVEEELPLLQPSAAVLDESWETLSPEEKAELADLGIYGPEGMAGTGTPETNPFGTKRDPREQGVETLGEYIPDPLPEGPRREGHLSGVRRPLTVRGSDVEPAARRSEISQLPPETASSDIFRDLGESSTEVPASPISDLPYQPLKLDRDKVKLRKLIEGLEETKGPGTIPADRGGGPRPVPY